MKNLHLIPTENYSPLVHSTSKYGGLFRSQFYSPMKEMGDSYQHLYITSDEEIKEGDWFFDGENVLQASRITDIIIDTKGLWSRIKTSSRVVLTTDQDLIADGVQAIDDEFLQWFVNNPSCESVEVKYENICARCHSNDTDECWSAKECSDGKYDEIRYKIIIPKEEPKEEGYVCPQTKIQCDDECCVSAEDCHIEASIGILSEPKQEYNNLNYGGGFTEEDIKRVSTKQETLEEAAEKHIEKNSLYFDTTNEKNHSRVAFIVGAKWQAERMYSELSIYLEEQADKDRLKSLTSNQIRAMIEQFKKK